MPQYVIPCDVRLRGATMIVEAATPEEALAKARANEWDDIEYNTAELTDWKITGKPQL